MPTCVRLMAAALALGLAAPLSAAEPGSTLAGFLRVGKIDGDIRVMYMRRAFDLPQTQESLAGGGWLHYETPPWQGVSAGLAGYLSQRLGIVPGSRDGANLLAPGQTSYSVLGQAYLQAGRGRSRLKLYRQMLETPFLNSWDIKMVPVTYEAYTLVSSAVPHVEFTVSHVSRIKPWTSSRFLAMSAAAGFPGTDYPVTLAGAVYRPSPSLTLQGWDYYCYEFMNVAYLQADSRWGIWRDLDLGLSAQGFLQRDAGKAVGGRFQTGMFGLLSQAFWKGLTVRGGYTATDREHDIVNPWASYPGYTSIMEEDCDLAGEQAWLLGAAYDFQGTRLDGLKAFADYTRSAMIRQGWDYPFQREADLTVDYRFKGWATGLWLRLRGAWVNNSHSRLLASYSDYRAILNFGF
ncbi:MAG: OprD family outer membrane porin [Elusimicrobia bacterium]|nr:OprD family outer membrane porin [Elusimicrobiota bacterium]